MPLKLHELVKEEEFKPIVEVEHEAYSKPLNGFWEMLKGDSHEEFGARQWLWHTSDPSSRWVYVTDEATGEVIGATNWNIHETSPYTGNETPLTAYWIPEGPKKLVGDQMMSEFSAHRPGFLGKPHMLISYCAVHSAHRRRGAARMMLQWGLDKADELGLDAFVESTLFGRPAYEDSGFQVIDKFVLNASAGGSSEEILAVRKEFDCPMAGWIMKREAQSNKH
ncbi:hypothetical protein F4778DRAFT_752751 [Xylariomycetidae sp. FL2044]|nr:hypothetical protein F4778DRAFT_752751 [Xylariomycetidae sp. FL2044]